jgi:hypothetical protein
MHAVEQRQHQHGPDAHQPAGERAEGAVARETADHGRQRDDEPDDEARRRVEDARHLADRERIEALDHHRGVSLLRRLNSLRLPRDALRAESIPPARRDVPL